MHWGSVRWRPRRSAGSPWRRCGHHDPALLSQKDLVEASGTPSTSHALPERRHSRHPSYHQHNGTRQPLSCISQSGHFDLMIKVLWSSNNIHTGFLPLVSRLVASSPPYTHAPPHGEGCSSCHPPSSPPVTALSLLGTVNQASAVFPPITTTIQR